MAQRKKRGPKDAEQTPIAGMEEFEQKKIGVIENQADRVDEAKNVFAAGRDDLINKQSKLKELLTAKRDELEVTKDEDGVETLTYTRGEYKIVYKLEQKESLTVKIADVNPEPPE